MIFFFLRFRVAGCAIWGFLDRKGTTLGFVFYIKFTFGLMNISDPCASVPPAGSQSSQHWENAGSTGMKCLMQPWVLFTAAASGGFFPRVIW